MHFHFITAAKLGFELERLEFQRMFGNAVNGQAIPSTAYIIRTSQIVEAEKRFNRLEHAVYSAAHLLGEAWALGGLQANLEIYKDRVGSRYSDSLKEILERKDKLGIFRTALCKLTYRNTIEAEKYKQAPAYKMKK
jgi:hypothetical protein